ncbi:hypothetical protein Tco_0859034 [Tanacetum coccineum]|uniref:Uncharacterized protein n=1 Tax=Tanacetum coccineum TaxID=301880 RepID=A0ABQ5BDT6_9ASTR
MVRGVIAWCVTVSRLVVKGYNCKLAALSDAVDYFVATVDGELAQIIVAYPFLGPPSEYAYLGNRDQVFICVGIRIIVSYTSDIVIESVFPFSACNLAKCHHCGKLMEREIGFKSGQDGENEIISNGSSVNDGDPPRDGQDSEDEIVTKGSAFVHGGHSQNDNGRISICPLCKNYVIMDNM